MTSSLSERIAFSLMAILLSLTPAAATVLTDPSSPCAATTARGTDAVVLIWSSSTIFWARAPPEALVGDELCGDVAVVFALRFKIFFMASLMVLGKRPMHSVLLRSPTGVSCFESLICASAPPSSKHLTISFATLTGAVHARWRGVCPLLLSLKLQSAPCLRSCVRMATLPADAASWMRILDPSMLWPGACFSSTSTAFQSWLSIATWSNRRISGLDSGPSHPALWSRRSRIAGREAAAAPGLASPAASLPKRHSSCTEKTSSRGTLSASSESSNLFRGGSRLRAIFIALTMFLLGSSIRQSSFLSPHSAARLKRSFPDNSLSRTLAPERSMRNDIILHQELTSSLGASVVMSPVGSSPTFVHNECKASDHPPADGVSARNTTRSNLAARPAMTRLLVRLLPKTPVISSRLAIRWTAPRL
mmetsp:Transcript_21404/g.51950  ORF Transcript_21404/g.51950 Transcript_21404/m.51950 type:complete len:420 (-) Transcript_21404:717-1976(-)